MILADREIAALDQRVAEVASQKCVFKISFVIRPGREHHDARILPLHRHHPQQRVAIGLKIVREATHVRGAEDVGHYPAGDQTVLERIARA